MPEHRPTHTVLVPWPVRGTDREDRVVAGTDAAEDGGRQPGSEVGTEE